MVPQSRKIEWKILLHPRLNVEVEWVPISSVAQANVDKWTLLRCGANIAHVCLVCWGAGAARFLLNLEKKFSKN